MIQGEHQPYDKSSKWLIQHHGDSMLRLAKVERIAAWRPAQAEVVQPTRNNCGAWCGRPARVPIWKPFATRSRDADGTPLRRGHAMPDQC